MIGHFDPWRRGATIAAIWLSLAGCSPAVKPDVEHKKLTVFKVAAEASATAIVETPPAGEEKPAAHDIAEKPPVDPVVVNGEIFTDWPTPQLAILFSGELDGYIEPCGCAGLENQLGGLKRRNSLIKQLEGQGWPLLKLDVGGLTKRIGPQTEVKLCYELEAFVKMGYSAVGLGANDLKLSADALAYALSNLDAAANPMLSANVGIYAMDSGMTRPWRVETIAGKRIGVTAVLGAKHVAALKNVADVVLIDPVEALTKIAPQLAAEKCDLQILLVHGDPSEAAALSQQFPQFQVVMAAGGAEVPPKFPKTIPGSGAALVEAGHKGMYVIVLGVFDDPDPAKRYRYQRVPLDSRFADSPEMQAVLVAYQKELEAKTLAGLGLTGIAHPDGEFAGSAVCADCHTQATEVWEKTPHSHATTTLMKLEPPRQFDPECLSCHATGWNPQEYFPYTTGFIGVDATPDLMQNGCENCHGPGKAHADAEYGNVEATDAQKKALAAALHLKVVEGEGNKEGQKPGAVTDMCMKCHDIDNSPEFDFQKYWQEVKHEGVD